MPANANVPEERKAAVRRRVKPGARPKGEAGPRKGGPSGRSGGVGRYVSAFTVRQSDVTAFLRQFIMLIESGTPILKSLKSLAERGERATRVMVSQIARDVEGGSQLYQAFQRQSRSFDDVFVSLIKASEASGTLVTVLRRVVAYRERRELLRKRVRGGMFYPCILLLACFGVVLFISKFVMPEFEDVFKKLSTGPLPVLTRTFMGFTDFVSKWWWACVLVVIGLVILYKAWWVRDPRRRLDADRLKLRLPILGPILRKNAIVEMTRLWSLLLRSGLPMMQTLQLVRNTIHNRAVAQIVQHLSDSVERGEGLEAPLRAAPAYIVPSVVTDMLLTGEESGRLDGIAEQIADTYEEEVDIAISTLGEALQPVLTVFIGVLVVLVMLAVFIPLISMIDTLGSQGV